jgi:hypothetical protein
MPCHTNKSVWTQSVMCSAPNCNPTQRGRLSSTTMRFINTIQTKDDKLLSQPCKSNLIHPMPIHHSTSSSPFSPHINPIRPWLLSTLGQASTKWGSENFCTQPALRPLTKCHTGIIAAYLSFKPQSISSRSVTPMNLSHPSIRYQEHCKLRTQLEHTNPSQVGTITSQLSVGLCFERSQTNS